MKVVPTKFPDVLVVSPNVYKDERGYFYEAYNSHAYADAGIPDTFVQDNVSFSKRGVLRGLHLQSPNAQGKLIAVLSGEIFDVAVDIKPDSPTFGDWVGVHLSAQSKNRIWIPPGYAHGFCVTSESAEILYKCTTHYDPASEHTLAWNDPDVGVRWPIDAPIISQRDAAGLPLARFR